MATTVHSEKYRASHVQRNYFQLFTSLHLSYFQPLRTAPSPRTRYDRSVWAYKIGPEEPVIGVDRTTSNLDRSRIVSMSMGELVV